MAGTPLSSATTSPRADTADIQGLVRSGYDKTLPEACYLLLRVTDAGAARRWLAEAPITSAADLDRRVATALQVALTVSGLRALGVTDAVIAGFSPEFLSGMAGEDGRSRRLGDVEANAPPLWRWGSTWVPDVLMMLYAERDLASWRARVTGGSFESGFAIVEDLATGDMDGREPFGFVDGVSQPRLDWAGERKPDKTADLEFGNLATPGEFLLGYPNEYGLYTERPLLAATDSGAAELPAAEDDPGFRDLGRNGAYLVFRELHQDVRAFWRFLIEQAGSVAEAVVLGETFVGRRMTGEPLVAPDRRVIRGIGPNADEIGRNQFTYEADREGLRCPLGAHVRRANPRTGDMPGGRQSLLSQLIRTVGLGHPKLSEDLVASSRFHRLLRRGREFGRLLTPEQVSEPGAADPASGLFFMCLTANIARQFEFVQNAWLMSAKFDGLDREGDPLTGNRARLPATESSDDFSLPQPNGVRRRITGLPRFVTVRGGGYFFLPGLRALRYIAGGAESGR